MSKAVYLHIPFCASICSYCDFTRCGYNESLADQYLKALKMQVDQLQGPYETLYIGGGTPTSLSAAQLTSLFDLLEPYLSTCKEITMEVNPETMNEEKYYILQHSRVKRVSIGVQSTEPSTLLEMNRKHRFEDVIFCVQQFKQRGIHNFSLDLIYGWPNQTLADLARDLERLVALDPPHLSIYSLTIEPNSELGRHHIEPVSVDLETQMFEYIVTTLKQAGYRHYEVANFCKSGYESAHNQVYWRYDDFTGIGLGASGKQGATRYTNTTKFLQYLENPLKREEEIFLTPQDQYFEYLMMNLRTDTGVSFEHFEEKFKLKFDKAFNQDQSKIQTFVDAGFLVHTPSRLWATSTGRMMLNDILLAFME